MGAVAPGPDRVDFDPATKRRALRLVERYHAADPPKISVQSLLDNTAADERPGAEPTVSVRSWLRRPRHRAAPAAVPSDRVMLAIAASSSATRCANGREPDANGIDSRPFAPAAEALPGETSGFPASSAGFESRPPRPVHPPDEPSFGHQSYLHRVRSAEPVLGPVPLLHSARSVRTSPVGLARLKERPLSIPSLHPGSCL
jgi:hypothetical protein